MTAPNMATMLAYILTNAAVQSRSLQKILSQAADETFNAITVDGDTSTNDTVLFLESFRRLSLIAATPIRARASGGSRMPRGCVVRLP